MTFLPWPAAWRVGLLAGLALSTACASTAHTDPPQFSLSPDAKVLEPPRVQQDALHECGLVAISALCAYHGVALTEAEHERLVGIAAESNGLSGPALREVLESRGLEVSVFEGELGDGPRGLKHHVDRGRPLLVMTAVDDASRYSLFIGYDPALDSVVLLDPRRGRIVLSTADFERAWEQSRRFTLLALPREGSGEESAVSQASAGSRS